jgi:hypothetical protein
MRKRNCFKMRRKNCFKMRKKRKRKLRKNCFKIAQMVLDFWPII